MKQNNKKFNNAMHKFVGVLDKYGRPLLVLSPGNSLCFLNKITDMG